jgi:glutamate dehydrogenase
MKIDFVAHGHSGKVMSIPDLLIQLDQRINPEENSYLRPLAEVLLQQVPGALRGGLNADQLFDTLESVSSFLLLRKKAIKVKLLPFAGTGRYFLFANASDANYIFTSIQEYLHREAFNFRVICHPIFAVTRKNGKIVTIASAEGEGERESFVWIELNHFARSSQKTLLAGVESIIAACLQIEESRQTLLDRITRLSAKPELKPHVDLFEWLCNDNFLPIAARSFSEKHGEQVELVDSNSSSVNLFNDPLGQNSGPLDLCRDVFGNRTTVYGPVVLEKSALRNPIHHFERLTYLGIRESISSEEVIEHGFWGFYAQQEMDQSALRIPALYARIDKVLKDLHVLSESHNYRKIREILNSFPKVELFLMSDDELHRMVRFFVQMHRQSGVKIVVAPNMSGSGLTLLLIMPRSFYSAASTLRIESYLKRYFKAQSVESRIIHLSTDYLSVLVGLRVLEADLKVDTVQLEHGLTRLALPWNRKFRQLLELDSEQTSAQLYRRYHNAFDAEYKTRLHPRLAVRDVRNVELILQNGEAFFDLWGPFDGAEHFYRLIYYKKTRSYLNDLMPFLENLGLIVIEEVDYQVRPDEEKVFIKSFAIRARSENVLPLTQLKPLLLETLNALDRGEVENDYLHQLLLLTGLNWQEIDVFRAYRNYYFQLGTTFTKKRVAYALIHNPQVCLLLYRYFEGRFKPCAEWDDPAAREDLVLSPVRMELAEALSKVEDSNEDQILRTLFNLIDSTVRTGFYKRREMDDYFISFKISSLGVFEMPAPRPMFEVYVHSVDMEGIHLRGGKVARGGIRWSDRPDDFRTEVLGLMKAQMTKNSVIVPEGSKGGFIVKTPFSSREEGMALVKDAYRHLMMGLLDLTDNQSRKGIKRPAGIIAYDEEDPYLVVAADKGTAHLPDTANAISDEYNFWLGDAFASGGSHGYDHKKLGITARGAWEGVKRHFREMGHDTQSEEFTVVGIGDMSGDVFGNGMLLSKHIRLKAAFDHRHIFLDPDPDAASSFRERERLFMLPRSSWEDYNPELISAGGGVFSRELKEIPLSPQMRKWLGVRNSSIDVPGLIHLLLKADVDLLWNGGIGTYVKASTESDADAGDRHNDGVRVDADQLRCKVIGEGGNLGLTQSARIEFAALGGRVNTDAIDNSAGVDSSDHEVNLKILLQVLRNSRKMKSLEEGYELLAEMEETVCQDVLTNNYTQTLSISLDEIRCQGDVEPHLELLDRLGRSGLLDRRGEFLPSRKEVATRQAVGLLRPELSVLLAYSKMALFRELLDQGLPAGPIMENLLYSYFPQQARERYPQLLEKHPLADEIAATVMTNHIVDCAGSSFCLGLARLTGVSQSRVAQSYLLVDHLLQGEEIRQAVFALDNKMSSQQQYLLLLELEQILANFCHFILSNDLQLSQDAKGLKRLNIWLEEYIEILPGVLAAEAWQSCRERKEELNAAGLPPAVAERLAILPQLKIFLPLVRLVKETGLEMGPLVKLSVEVLDKLCAETLIDGVESIALHNSWDRSARGALLGNLHNAGFGIVKKIALEHNGESQAFFRSKRRPYRTYKDMRERLAREEVTNFHPYTVLLRALEDLLNS